MPLLILSFLAYSFFFAGVIIIIDKKLGLKCRLLNLCGSYKVYKIVSSAISFIILLILKNWIVSIIVYHQFTQIPDQQF